MAGVGTGARDVAERLASQEKACPNQVFALVGYSQGASVMNSAAKRIPATTQKDKIKALVMFGDPSQHSEHFTPTLTSKLYENCEACDSVREK
jgi:cutinase